MRRISLVIIALLSQFLTADDVYMRTGTIMRNVKFSHIEAFGKDPYFVFTTVDRPRRIPTSNVIYVDSSVAYDPTGRTFMEAMPDSLLSKYSLVPETKSLIGKNSVVYTTKDDTVRQRDLSLRVNTPQREFPNLIWLSVSALSATIAWEYFNVSDHYQSQIELNNKLNETFIAANSPFRIDNGPNESAKTRALIIGTVSAVSCIVVTVHALKSVEIKTDGKSISLAYSF